MCGIGGLLDLRRGPVPRLRASLATMNTLLAHRGPDGHDLWQHPAGFVGLAHRRLSIIDLDTGAQPMTDGHGNWITYNGEIYNYKELRAELGPESFKTTSDTEVILLGYRRWGARVLDRLRGMFAFALWDEERGTLLCARDRFGIKPFHYVVDGDRFAFASEIKALLPFLPQVETDVDALKDYLTFQFCFDGKTLFRGVRELLPGHLLEVGNGSVTPRRYWEVYFQPDFDHTERYFVGRVQEELQGAVELHLRSDVPVGAYVSGGIDSSLVAALAAKATGGALVGFTGRFALGDAYDESRHAHAVARHAGFTLHQVDITADDFVDNIERVLYHLDVPVAGPGAFPQYMVSRLARSHRKAVLGGQGGDEIFGGYVRYLMAYFEQCIKAAIDGTMNTGSFIVTYESIIPNLTALRGYQPLLQELWREGLFEAMERRYFRLINRANDQVDEVDWGALGPYSPFDTFKSVFLGDNVQKESYFDRMTHFDFKTLLPALLHVEDRMSMAHGLESRVPLLDTKIVELAATMPSNVKFKDGALKHVVRLAARGLLPDSVLDRKDKMGFPVPLQEWITAPGRVRDFVRDTFTSTAARTRPFLKNDVIAAALDKQPKFGRKLWGLLSLELWQRRFHDRAAEFRVQEIASS